MGKDIGKKYLILLNSPSKDEPYLYVKVTSQKKDKPAKVGCIPNLQLFFIPAGTAFFKKDMWIQLYEIYEFQANDVSISEDIEIVGSLPHTLIEAIVDCVFQSREDDILPLHKKLLRPTLQESLQKLAEKFSKKQ